MLKSNKGITLISLTIYMIVLIIVIAIMSNILGYFRNNIDEVVVEEKSEEQYLRFLQYITNDINSDNLEFIKVGNNTDETSSIQYVIFKYKDRKQHQYIVQNGNMYFIEIENNSVKKKILLCYNVTSANEEENIFNYSDRVLAINLKINGKAYSSALSAKYE